MDHVSVLTPDFVALAQSLVERWEAGETHFDSFDTDLAEFTTRSEVLFDNPITLARLIAAGTCPTPTSGPTAGI